jgi:hypothetical protein
MGNDRSSEKDSERKKDKAGEALNQDWARTVETFRRGGKLIGPGQRIVQQSLSFTWTTQQVGQAETTKNHHLHLPLYIVRFDDNLGV